MILSKLFIILYIICMLLIGKAIFNKLTVPEKNIEEFEILKSENPERLKLMHNKLDYSWDSEVIRIIFDKGTFKIFDISGDIEVPEKNQYPDKTLLCYGSSITHGSNAFSPTAAKSHSRNWNRKPPHYPIPIRSSPSTG